MEASSSSNTTNQDLMMPVSVVDNKTKIGSGSVGGRKSEEIVADLVEVSSDEVSSEELNLVEDTDEEEDYDVEDSEEEDSDDDDEEYDEEEEEEDRERTRILGDLKQLKKLADFFQHPEKSVEVDGFAAGRSFFGRPSAPEVVSEDEDEAIVQALADARALKESAGHFLHPERPLEVDATACARNYFSQPWASEQETFGQAEERARLVGESKQLLEQAVVYRHPEAPVDLEPATSMARNYFQRASAPEETTEEQDRILEDMKALKKLAVDYMHPEKALEMAATASGRNYFMRPSAPEQEEDEHCDDREIILEEMKELKQAAEDYMHPEKPFQMDSTCARNYFYRASAPGQEEDAAEKELILQEMKAFKKLAVDYMHPEKPLEMDPTASGRNYFMRPSAPEQEEDEYTDDREIILEEMKELKQAAEDYMHPERPFQMDSTCARTYFDRASAPGQEEDSAEKELILQEMKALKKLAVDYMHPEMPLEMDPTASGRNYFMRPSAPEQEEDEYTDDREIILEEMKELKQAAVDYMHPEKPFQMDSTCARNYFDRASAPEQDDAEEQRAKVLEEMAQLKKLASDYMHPEKPIAVDPCAFGRNYFMRPSAPEQEEDEHTDDREIILEEMKELKQAAVDYMHPERAVSVDPAAFGRIYFGRASAPDQETFDSTEELAHVLAESSALKKNAIDFAHPELPVATDATVFGRNYYSRPSAPNAESLDEAEERARVLADAMALKKFAADFAHPETPVSTDATACARSYFSRASAPEEETAEYAEERAHVLAEADALKKLAGDYHHPEVAVKTADPSAYGRNYFSRASAAGIAENISSSGFANPTENHSHAEEHSHHDDYGHFEMDEDIFYDMRQSIVLPLPGDAKAGPKIQSSKLSSEEEGELSRSPSSVMLFTGAIDDADHPPLPSMG